MRTELEGLQSDALNKAVILVESHLTSDGRLSESYLAYEESLLLLADYEKKLEKQQRERNR